LTNAFDVQFRSSADLEKRLTGTYKGSLQQVVSRILAGYTFFVKSDETGLEITLLGLGKTIAVVGASSASKVAMRRADATTEPSPAANPVERPVPVPSSGGPIPTKTLAEGPRPMPSASGPAPGPVPGPALSSVPLPSPAAPGSAPGPVPGPTMSAAPSPPAPGATPPVPERGASAGLPPPVPGATPLPAPPSPR
jgi:hypothetical protein